MNILRGHLTLLLCVFCALSQGQAFEQKISYQNQGASIDQVIKDLSEQSGVPMDVGRSLKGEVLVISVTDVTIGELMKRIADTLNAEWEMSGETYRIIRSVNAVRKQDEKERAVTAAMIQEQLQKIQKEVATMPPFDESKANYLALQAKTYLDAPYQNLSNLETLQNEVPHARLVRRILSDFDTDTLSQAITLSLTNDTGVIFALNPRGSELPLRLQNNQAIEQYEREQFLYIDALKKQVTSRINSGPNSSIFGLQPPNSIADIYVIVWSQNAGTAKVDVKLYDSQNNQIATHSISLQNTQHTVTNYTTLGKEDELIPLSSEANELATFINSIGTRPFDVSDELRETLLDPVHQEPLEIIVGNALIKIAKQKELQLVACPPDHLLMFWSALQPSEGYIAPEGFLRWIAESCHIERDNKWLSIKPQNPFRERMDRSELAIFLNKAEKRGGASLNDIFQFSPHIPDESPLILIYLHAIAPQLGSSVTTMGSDLIKSIATLSPTQIEALKRGAKLPVRELSPMKQQELFQSVRQMGFAFAHPGSPYKHSFLDTKIIYAKGLPVNAYIEFEHKGPLKSYRFVYDENFSDPLGGSPLSEENLAKALGVTLYRTGKPIPKDALLRQGELTIWRIYVHLEEGVQQRATLYECTFPPTRSKIRIGDLPTRVLEAIEAEREKWRKRNEQQITNRANERKP